MTDSFVFYRSFYEAVKDLDDKERLAVYDAICEYALNQNDEPTTVVSKGMMTLIKPQLDANLRKRQNGTQGGRPKNDKQAEASQNQEETKEEPSDNQDITEVEPNVNVNVNANVNENVNANVTPNRRFVKPSLEDVASYCLERNNNVDPEEWYDYYVSNGWKVGKVSMKDWKACVRRWERAPYRKNREEPVPVYSTASNEQMSKDEEEELLRLMKGQ